jgi:sigma-54 dependent transcriptional regulator, flagellar regulatory protein
VVDAKVIVMEPSDSQARTLEAVLKFLDLSPVRFHDLAELGRKTEGAHDWLALIVGAETIAREGPELVARLRALAQPLPVIYLSSDGLPKIAESSGDLAWLHLELPVKQRRLSAVLNQAQNVRNGHPTQPGTYHFRPSGTSAAMRAIHRLVEQVAPFDTNVLILGESGTGKEMVARHVHELSGRSGHPFVPVNCGAIPADLLESELFGHEKGAFTGALSTRVGRFEFAEGGTLFLDEIGDMSLQMQVKLLRILQERSFERVGSNRTIDCNVRIIAATHRDLDAAILAGRFREDLFYRLNVFPVQMPPLRERLEDLSILIEHLLCRQGQNSGRHIRLDKSAMHCLVRNRWPGNVRELANLLERLAILYPDQTISAADLPERYRAGGSAPFLSGDVRVHSGETAMVREPLLLCEADAADEAGDDEEREVGFVSCESIDEDLTVESALQNGGINLKDHLSAIEIGLIRKALEKADGTVAEAARLLNMRRTTLVEKLRKYRLCA